MEEPRVPILFSISSNVDGSVEISTMGNDCIKLNGAEELVWFVEQILDAHEEAKKRP